MYKKDEQRKLLKMCSRTFKVLQKGFDVIFTEFFSERFSTKFKNTPAEFSHIVGQNLR